MWIFSGLVNWISLICRQNRTFKDVILDFDKNVTRFFWTKKIWHFSTAKILAQENICWINQQWIDRCSPKKHIENNIQYGVVICINLHYLWSLICCVTYWFWFAVFFPPLWLLIVPRLPQWFPWFVPPGTIKSCPVRCQIVSSKFWEFWVFLYSYILWLSSNFLVQVFSCSACSLGTSWCIWTFSC